MSYDLFSGERIARLTARVAKGIAVGVGNCEGEGARKYGT